MDVAFEERLLAAGGEDPVDRLARDRHPEREQHAGDGLTSQVDHDLAEVDLSLGARPVGLREEHLRGTSAGLFPDLRLAVGDVGPDDLVRNVSHAVLVEQTVIDLPDGVPLLAGRVEISPQDIVDRRLERIKLRTPRRHRLARRRQRRRHSRADRAPPHPILLLDRPARHPRSGIAADRREQLDLRHPRHRPASVSGQPMLPPPGVVSKLADIESIRSSVHLPWCRN